MALSHTILTVLTHSPSSGYDISKRFDEEVSCFWKASPQQIYRELAKMEDLGWVVAEIIPQEGKPDKKIYSVTPAGMKELTKWLGVPTEPTPIREDLLVKVLAGTVLSEADLLEELHRRRCLHVKQLLRYRDREALYKSNPHPSKLERLRYLTLRRGIRYEAAWVDWCDEVLMLLSDEDSAAPPLTWCDQKIDIPED